MKKIPHLKTEKEVHQFWSKHSLTDYTQDMKEVDEKIQLAPELASEIRERTRKKMISLRLEKWQLERAKAVAHKKHMSYQLLLRHWISQGLKHEAVSK